ncbi:hypothetical protein GDO78_007927 [Eleutherodactylus coqui]|uniref:Uncharacterized protein n=1 Tax=Eleutherodactylus coqui TaxID=57060 RepID=A0A8J6KE64_ELECQ|nr:hypothetical protein GDO78_007927 [Eleutherodactylus coqui]
MLHKEVRNVPSHVPYFSPEETTGGYAALLFPRMLEFLAFHNADHSGECRVSSDPSTTMAAGQPPDKRWRTREKRVHGRHPETQGIHTAKLQLGGGDLWQVPEYLRHGDLYCLPHQGWRR